MKHSFFHILILTLIFIVISIFPHAGYAQEKTTIDLFRVAGDFDGDGRDEIRGLQKDCSWNLVWDLEQNANPSTPNEGEQLEFTVTATDLDKDDLTYYASNFPQGATFDRYYAEVQLEANL